MVYEARHSPMVNYALAGACPLLSVLGFAAAGVIPTNSGSYPVVGWAIVAACFARRLWCSCAGRSTGARGADRRTRRLVAPAFSRRAGALGPRSELSCTAPRRHPADRPLRAARSAERGGKSVMRAAAGRPRPRLRRLRHQHHLLDRGIADLLAAVRHLPARPLAAGPVGSSFRMGAASTYMARMSVRPWRDIERRKSRQIMVGNVPVGGDAPVTVQTMTNTPTSDAKATIDQIRRCEEAGADIVRVSCPDRNRPRRSGRSSAPSHVPIVADIHFHYKRALEAADAGAACLRINPGNIGSAERVSEVVNAAKANGCSMRIGVNAGSLEKDLLEKYGEPCPEALVESALDHIRILEDHDFREYKVAVKASDRVPRGRRLSAARRSGRLPAASRHHRGRRPARRHRQERDRHRLAALGRHRRHDPRLALGRAGGGGPGRLRDPEERSASATAASASSPARPARARAST